MDFLPSHPLTRLRLAEGVVCTLRPGRAELVVEAQTAFVITDAPALRLLAALRAGPPVGADADDLAAVARSLVEAGLLAVDFLAAPGGELVASLQSSGHALPLRLLALPADWRLHRHAVLRPDGAGWCLSCPLSSYRLQLARAGLLDELLDGRREAATPGTGGPTALLAQALWAAGLAEGADDCDGAAEAWTHEDLLFHVASRRHADHRPRSKRAEWPAWAPPVPVAGISLPLAEDLRRRLQSLPFEAVLAQRRSVRGSLPTPTMHDLRDLLRAVQAERRRPTGAPGRAYPMAGGQQALDFHLVTAAQAGAAAALHRYDASTGELRPIDAPAGSAQRLLDEAAQAWGEVHGTPCALVVVTARLPELAARYEASACRLALLEAGGASLLLMQVAMALGIGTCMLGNGDSTLFAWASGLSEWQAPAIAEIAIAGRLDDQR